MKKAIRLLAILAAATAVSGCQSFPLTSWMFKDRPAARDARTTLAGSTIGALEEGNAFLRAGNISAAVASYRIASLDPSARGDASNGLAVAYARLGRPDLAERYFRAAIAVEPDNPKFVANLLRLQQQVLLARGREAPSADVIAVPARPAQSVLAPRDALTGPAERVSRAEVMVRSGPPAAAAPAMAVIYRDAAEPADAGASGRPSDEERPAAVAAASAHPITVAFGE